MEDSKHINLLSEGNFKAIMGWLENPDSAEPEYASSFMTTLNFIYMQKKGMPAERTRRRQPIRVDAFPSLRRLMESVENKLAEKPSPVAVVKASLTDKSTESELNSAPEPKQEPELFSQEAEEKSAETTEKTTEVQELPVIKASTVGKAIRHCARLHDVKISDSHIQLILYVLYGVRLAKEQEDIFKETPQMWKYGPVFVSVYSQLKKPLNINDEYECWKAVNRYDVKLGTDIINLISGLGERKVTELTKKHTAPDTPWHECRVMNPDKWGTYMSEDVIRTWFKNNIEKRTNK